MDENNLNYEAGRVEEIELESMPFCVISINTFGDYEMHDIQTSFVWFKNPYETGYAVVPDDLVEGIRATRGFCDIELNEEGTEVVSFTAREIPDIPKPDPEPDNGAEEDDGDVWAEMAAAINEGVNEV